MSAMPVAVVPLPSIVSGDDKVLFSTLPASDGGEIVATSVETGETIGVFGGGSSAVRTLIFHGGNGDGDIFTGHVDGAISRWGAKSLKMLWTADHGAQVNSLLFTKGGRLWSAATGGNLKQWDVSPEIPEVTLRRGEVTYVVYDGASVWSGSVEGDVRQWNLTTRCVTQEFRGPGGVTFLLPEEDSRLWTAHSSGKIGRFFPDPNKPFRTFNAHEAAVCYLLRVHDVLWSGSLDKTLKCWNPSSGECLRILMGHSHRVSRIVFAHGKLWSASDDRTVLQWGSDSDLPLNILKHRTWVTYMLPDEDCLWTAALGGVIRKWDPTGRLLGELLRGHTRQITCLLRDERNLWSASFDGTVRQWDASSGVCERVLNSYGGPVTCLLLAAGSLWSACESGTLRQWDPASGRCKKHLHGHGTSILCLGHAEGCIWSASKDGSILAWPDDKEQCLVSVWADNDEVVSVQLLQVPCSKESLWAASPDGTMRQWDSESGGCLRIISSKTCNEGSASDGAPNARVTCFVFSNDKLWTGWDDGSLRRLWASDTASNGEQGLTKKAHPEAVTWLLPGHKSSFWSASSTDSAVNRWQALDGLHLQTVRLPEVVGTVPGSNSKPKIVQGVSFLAVADMSIVAVSRHGSLIVWHRVTGERILSVGDQSKSWQEASSRGLNNTTPIGGLHVTGDGKAIVARHSTADRGMHEALDLRLLLERRMVRHAPLFVLAGAESSTSAHLRLFLKALAMLVSFLQCCSFAFGESVPTPDNMRGAFDNLRWLLTLGLTVDFAEQQITFFVTTGVIVVFAAILLGRTYHKGQQRMQSKALQYTGTKHRQLTHLHHRMELFKQVCGELLSGPGLLPVMRIPLLTVLCEKDEVWLRLAGVLVATVYGTAALCFNCYHYDLRGGRKHCRGPLHGLSKRSGHHDVFIAGLKIALLLGDLMLERQFLTAVFVAGLRFAAGCVCFAAGLVWSPFFPRSFLTGYLNCNRAQGILDFVVAWTFFCSLAVAIFCADGGGGVLWPVLLELAVLPVGMCVTWVAQQYQTSKAAQATRLTPERLGDMKGVQPPRPVEKVPAAEVAAFSTGKAVIANGHSLPQRGLLEPFLSQDQATHVTRQTPVRQLEWRKSACLQPPVLIAAESAFQGSVNASSPGNSAGNGLAKTHTSPQRRVSEPLDSEHSAGSGPGASLAPTSTSPGSPILHTEPTSKPPTSPSGPAVALFSDSSRVEDARGLRRPRPLSPSAPLLRTETWQNRERPFVERLATLEARVFGIGTGQGSGGSMGLKPRIARLEAKLGLDQNSSETSGEAVAQEAKPIKVRIDGLEDHLRSIDEQNEGRLPA